MKSRNQQTLSRSQILAWINKIIGCQQIRIQNLGTGTLYCLLINTFYPNTIPQNRIILIPRSKHQYQSNLRKLQQGLLTLEINNINIDIFKLSQLSYQQNWQLVCKLYKVLNEREKRKSQFYEQGYFNSSQNFINQSNLSIDSVKTPLKIIKSYDKIQGNRNMFFNGPQLIDKIKSILIQKKNTDKIKVRQLKKLLQIQTEDKNDMELNELLSDGKKKQQTICID